MRHPTTPSIAKKTATAAAVSYHVNWYGGGGSGGGEGGGGDGGGGATTSGTRTPVATRTGTNPKTVTVRPITADRSVDSVAGVVAARAARTLAADCTWATAALGLPGPLLGMVRSMENSTPAACHSRRPATCSRRPDGGRGPQSPQSVPSAHTLLKELVPPSLQTPSFMFNGL